VPNVGSPPYRPRVGWSCARCAGSNPEGTRFCGHCGTPVAVTLAEQRAAELAPVGDERREVTSLFADISGFTTLADRLDAEDLHAVISPVITGLAAIAERYEAYLVKYAGDALLFFFGAPVAHEDDPDRALLTALEMHAALPSLVQGLPVDAGDLQLHIGVTTGTVVSGHFGGDTRADYSILGDAVNVAQRLESVAPGGETYVAESTYQLTRHRFAFDPVGELALKGKLKPVVAYRLVGRQPSLALAPTATRRLIGRSTELRAIRPLLDPATHGGAVVAVTGEPGVGKSRLLHEVRDDVLARGGRWFDARCLSYGAALPYWPIVDLVRRTLGVAPDERTEHAVRRLRSSRTVDPSARPFLERLLGSTDVPPEVERLDPEAFRRHLHDAVASLLLASSAGRPVTVAVEDVHWADSSTLALLPHLVAAGVRLYVTARPEGGEVARALAGAAPAGRSCAVELGPLSTPAVRELLEAILEGDVPVDLVALVAARTGGNPLFVEELTRALVEQDAIRSRNGRWRLADALAVDHLPDTVERVVAGRIDLLPPRAAAVLQVASVVGRLVRLPLLRAAAEEIVDVDAALDDLVAGGFLDVSRDGDEHVLGFHHALVQQVAYERLLRRSREEIHRRVARAAVEHYGDGDDVVDLLARHLYLGGAGLDAVDPLLRAGRRAARMFANEEAIVHLARAADVLDGADDPTRSDEVLLELAELHAVRGDYDTALDLYRRVRARLRSVPAWLGEAAVLRRKGDYAAAIELVDEAIAAVGPSATDAASLWLERSWTCSVAGRLHEARSAVESGLATVGSDDVLRGRLLAQLAHVEDATGRYEEALDAATRAQAAFEQGEHERGLLVALRIAGSIQRHLGDLEAAVVSLRQAVALAERTGTVEELAGALLNLGMVHLVRGELDEGIRCDERAVAEFERLDHGSGQAVGYGNLAEKVLLAGDATGAVEWSQRALDKAKAIGHTGTIADAGRTYARALLALGSVADAQAAAAEAAAAFRALGDEDGARDCECVVAGTSLVS
jgi:adenylate cyclase